MMTANDDCDVLLIGASGQVGRALLSLFQSRGYRVRVFLRRESRRFAQVSRVADEVVVGDVADLPVSALLKGHCRWVISTLGVRSTNARPGAQRVDFRANAQLIDAILGAGRRMPVDFVCVMGWPIQGDDCVVAQAKERLVKALFAQKELSFCIVRPCLWLDAMADLWSAVAQGDPLAVAHSSALCAPIAVEDAARAVLHMCIHHHRFHRADIRLSGPEVWSWQAVGDLAADMAHKSRSRVSIEEDGGLSAVVRSIASPFARDALSLFLRSRLRQLQCDCVGQPYGRRTLRDMFVQWRLGDRVVDKELHENSAVTTRHALLLSSEHRVVSQLHSPIRASSPLKVPREDAVAIGCHRITVKLTQNDTGHARIRWRFRVLGRGAKRIVFRVLRRPLVTDVPVDHASGPPSPTRRTLLAEFNAEGPPLPSAPAVIDDSSSDSYSSASHASLRDVTTAAIDLASVAMDMASPLGVPTQTRTHLFTSYPNAFVGRDAVDWMINNRLVESRAEAEGLGRSLVLRHLITPLMSQTFGDDKLFYRFTVPRTPPPAPDPQRDVDDGVECLFQQDDCLVQKRVVGECTLPSNGLFTLVWTSESARFALVRPPPAELLYSVQLTTPASSGTKPRRVMESDDVLQNAYRAKWSFKATAARELSLAKLECVWVTRRVGDWWKGRRASDGRAGWIPSAFLIPTTREEAERLVAVLQEHGGSAVLDDDIDLTTVDLLAPPNAASWTDEQMLCAPLSTLATAATDFTPLARRDLRHLGREDSPERLEHLLCVAYSDERESTAAAVDSDCIVSEMEILDETRRSTLSCGRWNDTPVCVREVAIPLMASAKARQALLDEQALLNTLSADCPSFCAVHGVWRSQTSGCLREGLVLGGGMNGGVLRTHICRAQEAPPLSDPLPLVQALSILRHVLRGMIHAKEHGYVLRDLQADTVLLSENPSEARTPVTAKLFDVSRARKWLKKSTPDRDVCVELLRVSPPESVAAKRPFFEPLSDVWNFGCLMFELFAWRTVYDGKSKSQVLAAIRGGQLPDIELLRPRYRGKRLLSLINACLRPLPQPMTLLKDKDSARINVSKLETLFDDLHHDATS